MTTARAIRQTVENITAVLRHHGLPTIAVLTTQRDRLTATVPDGFSTELEGAGFVAWPFVDNHGLTAVTSWREGCPRWSLQAIQHCTGAWEFDIDAFNPHPNQGIALTVAHAFEVALNILRRKMTDPFKVRRGLVKRGIAVPEAEDV